MLFIAPDGVAHIDGYRRLVKMRAKYYVEELCGACDQENCASFDETTDCIVELTFDQVKDHQEFMRVLVDGVRADVKARRPHTHDIPDEDVIFCPTAF